MSMHNFVHRHFGSRPIGSELTDDAETVADDDENVRPRKHEGFVRAASSGLGGPRGCSH